MIKQILPLAVVGLVATLAGCGKQAVPGEKPSLPAARKTDAKSVDQGRKLTFSDLPVAPKPAVTPDLLVRGKEIYAQNCVACHGEKGDGKGLCSAFLIPPPRNFINAKYRIRSTPSGNLPTDEDLFRAVSLGVIGTAMPPWTRMLNETDRWAVVEYIKTLSPRFADPSEDRKTLVQIGTPPPRNEAAIAEGKTITRS